MVIYLDLLWGLNFFLDFLILLIVSYTLRRGVTLRRVILGSLVGSLTTFLVFFKLSNLFLNIFKILYGGLIVIVTFNLGSKKYFWNNLTYFYMSSILLGGFMYFLNNNFNKSYSLNINYLLVILLSPIILYLYYKQNKEIKTKYQFYYEITITFRNDEVIKTKAFLDTGNTLKDPYAHKPIILLSKKLLPKDIHIHSPIIVPYDALNHHSLLTVIKPKYIKINDVVMNKYLVGLSEEDFGFDGVSCILNKEMLKENL